MPHPAGPDVAPYAAAAPRGACPPRFPGSAGRRAGRAAEVRANDTDYAFRATSVVHLADRRDRRRRRAGLTPDGDAATTAPLYVARVRPARRGRLLHQPEPRRALGRQRAERRTTPRAVLGHPHPAARARSATARAGTGHAVRAAARRRRRRSTRCCPAPTAARWTRSSTSCGWSRTSGRSAACGTPATSPPAASPMSCASCRTSLGRAGRPRRALARRHVLAAGPARGQRGRLHVDRRRRPARHRRCTGGATTASISAGQLLLADMGVETDELYTADVTRTLPVDGEWSPAQRQVYRAVQEAQAAGIAEVKAGADFLAAHRAAMYVLADHLHTWGILPVTADVSLRRRPRAPGRRAAPPVHAARHVAHARHRRPRLRARPQRDVPRRPAAGRLRAHRRARPVLPGQRPVGPGRVPRHRRAHRGRHRWSPTATPVNLSATLPRDPDEITAWMRDVQNTPAAARERRTSRCGRSAGCRAGWSSRTPSWSSASAARPARAGSASTPPTAGSS